MDIKKKWQDKIYAYGLENAISHNGKAVVNAVLSHLFKDGLEKKDIKKIIPLIQELLKKINSMSVEDQEKEFKQYKKKFDKIEKEKKAAVRKGLPELTNAKIGKFVTRLAPEPSKYNHIGHAMSFLINYMYAKKYRGKCLLRFEDTNPEKVSQEYVDAMMEDVVNYLGIKLNGIRYVSDDMPLLYKYAEKLIKQKRMFMCFCKRRELQDNRHKGKECKCRGKSVKENLEEWGNFKAGKYIDGQASLRLKGDMKSKNHVMRDPVMFRAIKARHYRHKDKYNVWPLYDFYNAIEDSIMKISHVFRSNEFESRVELQNYIRKLLNLAKIEIIQYGRFNIIGAVTQGREIRELIESGKYIGWDDPRLVTLRALKRRGIVKEVFYELVKGVGLSKHQVNLDFNMIAAINRKILDKKADRYFFVADPVKLEIKNMPKIKQVKVKIHPDKTKKRTITIGKEIYIPKKDFERFKGKEIRLMHLYNIKLGRNRKGIKIAEFTSLENKDIPKVHWVSEGIKVRVMMDNASWLAGLAEENIKKLKIGETIQFERFGFSRLDKAGKVPEFWFSHS